MRDSSFEVVYEIDERILNFSMPNLLLQPLVENAIQHGLDQLESGSRGLLRIEGIMEVDSILFRVSDNGPGIPQEKAATILRINDGPGYGVSNVHQRVQLLFGTDYGLSYKSSTSGTTASLRLPVEQAEKLS